MRLADQNPDQREPERSLYDYPRANPPRLEFPIKISISLNIKRQRTRLSNFLRQQCALLQHGPLKLLTQHIFNLCKALG